MSEYSMHSNKTDLRVALYWVYSLSIALLWSHFHLFSDEFDFLFISTRFFLDNAQRVVTNSYCEGINGTPIPITSFPFAITLSSLSLIENKYYIRLIGISVFLISCIPISICLNKTRSNLVLFLAIGITIGIMPIALIMVRGEYLLVILISTFSTLVLIEPTRLKLANFLRVFCSVVFCLSAFLHPKTLYFFPLVILIVAGFKSWITKGSFFIFISLFVFELIPFAAKVTQSCPNVPEREFILKNMNIHPALLIQNPLEFFSQLVHNYTMPRLELYWSRISLSDNYEHAFVPQIKVATTLDRLTVQILNFTTLVILVVSLALVLATNVIAAANIIKNDRRYRSSAFLILTVCISALIFLNKSQLFYDLSLANFLFCFCAIIGYTLFLSEKYRKPMSKNWSHSLKRVDLAVGTLILFVSLLNISKVYDDIAHPFLNGWSGSGLSLGTNANFEEFENIRHECLPNKAINQSRVITDSVAYPLIKETKLPVLKNWLWFYLSVDGRLDHTNPEPNWVQWFDETRRYAKNHKIDAMVMSCASFGGYQNQTIVRSGPDPIQSICCEVFD